jgi:hypothetical protein
MNTFSITYTYIYRLNFANNYVFSKCGKCMNLQTGRLIKKVYNSGCIGFNIKGKFYSLTRLRGCLEKINKAEKEVDSFSASLALALSNLE